MVTEIKPAFASGGKPQTVAKPVNFAKDSKIRGPLIACTKFNIYPFQRVLIMETIPLMVNSIS